MRFFLGWILTLITLSVGSLGAAERPNVVLIIVDDLNDWVGCLGGHPNARTPHMDRLAQQGTLFVNAHCQAPLCGPSRASFLSGLFPSTTGLYGQPRRDLEKDTQRFVGHLLPQYFSRHGYRTYGVGKITHGISLKAVVDVAGPTGSSGPKPRVAGGEAIDRFHYWPDESSPFSGTQTDWGAFPERDALMPDHQTAAWAVEKLNEASDPFFMAIGFHRPHVPFYVPERWFEDFPLNELALPQIQDGDLDDVPSIGRAIHELPRFPQLPFLQADDNAQWRLCVQAYLACVAFVDAQIGKVLAAVPSKTIVALISDHGYHLGEKNRVAKHSLWPESTRVPMIVRAPDVGRAGQRVDQPVGLIDLFPTLCDLVGIPAKAGLEGKSLKPLLEDPAAPWDRPAIRTTYARGNHSLQSRTHHYVRYEDGSEEYYDLRRDPHAWDNLAAQANRQDLEQLRGWLPKQEAPYHPASSPSPVNAWFQTHFAEQITGSDR